MPINTLFRRRSFILAALLVASLGLAQVLRASPSSLRFLSGDLLALRPEEATSVPAASRRTLAVLSLDPRQLPAPLFAIAEEIVAQPGVGIAARRSPLDLTRRVLARRQRRLERLFSRSPAATGSVLPSLLQALPDMSAAREGQVLVIRSGKATWQSLPVLHAASPAPADRPTAPRRNGGGGSVTPPPALFGGLDINSDSLTGILAPARGGTGLSSYAAGDLLTAVDASTLGRLSLGSTGQVLTVSGSSLRWSSTIAGNLTESSADARYLNVSGDTMTGALRLEKDGLGLSVSGTASGRVLHATAALTSSGTLSVDGIALVKGNLATRGTLSGNVLTVMSGANSYVLGNFGVGTSTPSVPLTVRRSTVSTNNADLMRIENFTAGGAGGAFPYAVLVLNVNQSNGGGCVKFAVNSVDGAYLCQSHAAQLLTLGYGAYAMTFNETTGNVGIGTTAPKAKLDVAGTISGSLLTQNGSGSNYFRGKLGIGTATPGAKLHVYETSPGNLDITDDATAKVGAIVQIYDPPNIIRRAANFVIAGTNVPASSSVALISVEDPGSGLAFVTRGTAGTRGARMVITGDGNVGVGTTNPLQRLSVVGGDIAADYGTGTANGYAFQLFTNAVQTILASNEYYDASSGLEKYTRAGGAAQIQLQKNTIPGYPYTAGDIVFLTAPSGTADAAISYTEQLRIGSNGKIGIGTTYPGAKLSISGSVVVGGNLAANRAAKAQLEVIGTISGSTIKSSGLLSASGGLVARGSTVFQSDSTSTNSTGVRFRPYSSTVASSDDFRITFSDEGVNAWRTILTSDYKLALDAGNEILALKNLTGNQGNIEWSLQADGARLGVNAGLFWTNQYATGTKDTGLIRRSAGIVKATDGSTGLGSIYAGSFSGTGLRIVGTTAFTGATILASSAAGVVPLRVKGFSGQTGNLQEWQDSTGTAVASLSAAGTLTAGDLTLTGGTDGYSRIVAGSNGIWVNYGNDMYLDSNSNVIYFRGAGTAVLGQIAGANWLLPKATITAASSAVTPLLVKAAGSQTANLVEYQDSGGTPLYYVKPEGGRWNEYLPYGSVLAGASSPGSHAFNTGATLGGAMTIYTGASSNKGLIIEGATSQSSNLQEWQSSAGTVLASVNSAGALTLGGAQAANDGILNLKSEAAATFPVVYDAINSLNWGKGVTSNTTQAFFTSSTTTNLALHPTSYGALVRPPSSSATALITRGAASQSANLQEWQNSASSALSFITPSGSGSFKAIAVGKTPVNGRPFEVVGTISGALLTQNGVGNNYFLGNVGLGTTSPSAALEISNSANWNNGYHNNLRLSGANYPALRFYSSTANRTSLIGMTLGTGDLSFSTNGTGDAPGTLRMLIEPDGDIVMGQGVTSTNTALSVFGTAGGAGFTTVKHDDVLKLALNNNTEFGGQAQFWLGRWEESSDAARTALTISLANGSVNPINANADTDVMTLLSSGKVGIGTTAPGAKLSVSGAILIDSDETSTSADMLKIVTNAGSANNTVFRVTATGGVYSDAPYNSAGADYAEWFQATPSGAPSDKPLQSGEVVCIDQLRANTVKRCERDGDLNVMGIVSTKPAFIGNSIGGADGSLGLTPPGYALIGLIGQVPAKVTASSGSIRPGDQLTAGAIPGTARKASAGESTVGVALEPYDGVGIGTINVLISRRNQSLTAEAVESRVLETIQDLSIEDEVRAMVADGMESQAASGLLTDRIRTEVEKLSVTEQFASVLSRLSVLEQRGASGVQVPSVASSFSLPENLTITGAIAAQSLEADSTLSVGRDARIGGNLYLEGSLIASDLYVPGGLAIEGDLNLAGTLHAARIDLEQATINDLALSGDLRLGSGTILLGSGSGEVVIASDQVTLPRLVVKDALEILGDVTVAGLATFLGDIEVQGVLTLDAKQAGRAVIPAGDAAVTVAYPQPFQERPIVTAASDDFAPWRIRIQTLTGFVIELREAAAQPVTFSWLAVPVRGVEEPAVIPAPEAIGAPPAAPAAEPQASSSPVETPPSADASPEAAPSDLAPADSSNAEQVDQGDVSADPDAEEREEAPTTEAISVDQMPESPVQAEPTSSPALLPPPAPL